MKREAEIEMRQMEQSEKMRKFYCVAFVFIAMVLMYLFIKVKIESNREYIFE